MPPPPGMELGAEPPPPPRTLPAGFERRTRFTGNLAVQMCLVFTVVGAITTVAAVRGGSWGGLVAVMILAAGIYVLSQGLRGAAYILDAFKNGRAVRGKVTSVHVDRQTKVGNKHPWEITYGFDVEGRPCEGSVQTFDEKTAGDFGKLPLVWILVVRNQPERNTLYPPVK